MCKSFTARGLDYTRPQKYGGKRTAASRTCNVITANAFTNVMYEYRVYTRPMPSVLRWLRADREMGDQSARGLFLFVGNERRDDAAHHDWHIRGTRLVLTCLCKQVLAIHTALIRQIVFRCFIQIYKSRAQIRLLITSHHILAAISTLFTYNLADVCVQSFGNSEFGYKLSTTFR